MQLGTKWSLHIRPSCNTRQWPIRGYVRSACLWPDKTIKTGRKTRGAGIGSVQNLFRPPLTPTIMAWFIVIFTTSKVKTSKIQEPSQRNANQGKVKVLKTSSFFCTTEWAHFPRSLPTLRDTFASAYLQYSPESQGNLPVKSLEEAMRWIIPGESLIKWADFHLHGAEDLSLSP